MKKIYTILFVLSVFMVPHVVNAWSWPWESSPDTKVDAVTGASPVVQKPITAGTLASNPVASKGSTTLLNPLKAESIQQLFKSLIEIVLVFALPIAVGFIMYGGFRLVMAQGNSTELTKAKQIIQWAIIGAVIIFGAKLILDVFIATVKSI